MGCGSDDMKSKLFMLKTLAIVLPVIFFVNQLCAGSLTHNTQKTSFPSNSSSQMLPPDEKNQNGLLNNNLIQIFETPNPDIVNGVALVIHGLNLKPGKMDAIIEHLLVSGIEVFNLSLYGHGKNYTHLENVPPPEARMASFKTVKYVTWQDEAYRAYELAQKRSELKNVPLIFIGFSLGGLIGPDMLTSDSDIKFDKMVLFAPALSIHLRAYTLKLLSSFPQLVLPSFSSEPYRANAGTPVAAYNSLFKAVSHFKRNISPKLNIPTLIFIDKKDELVSYKGLKKIKEDENLDQWEFYIVQKEGRSLKRTKSHLIIDRSSVGNHMWGKMITAISNHLAH